ncbi:MAG TPA: terminase small subunit [Gemmatimonadales bacterium]|nr:terminase small subunit [Gemmatimonadales bacterium]
MSDRNLTPNQERFCQEYLVDLNAAAAYRRAYPDATPKSADAAGPRLLGNVRVAARIAELQAARAERLQVEADDVLRELLVLARSDVRHFEVDDQGHLVLTESAPDQAWRAVASVKHRITSRGDDFTVREIEYRLWSKPEALRMLGEHLALFKQVHRHSGPNGGPIPIEDASLTDEERVARLVEIIERAKARGGR